MRLARDGQSVLLIDPRTYLGRDITATLRPWIMVDDPTRPDRLPEPIPMILDTHDLPNILPGTELPLHPDTVKRGLEDALMAANVDLIYASLPTGLCEDRLVTGNTSGRQIIRCRTIVDATETALVTRLAGGRFEQADRRPLRMSRTLEFDRVQPLTNASLPGSAHLGITGNAVRLHTGYREPGHILVECDIDRTSAAGVQLSMSPWSAGNNPVR
ncbi:MAG: FAD-dependent oxidoreductase [Chloroflexota bacterium]|nr:FAD-dependent oxidoreductase [Chloroflexota bacterium]